MPRRVTPPPPLPPSQPSQPPPSHHHTSPPVHKPPPPTSHPSPISETAAAPIHPLAKIAYNPSTLTSTLLSYSAPDLPDDPPPSLLRIGIYDPPSQSWKSSVSVTSPASFAKGYAPTFVVTLGPEGEVLGVSVKSALIDAGATRDFGPKVVVRAGRRARGPELNRPVVLGEDGKVGQVPLEKTLLQK